MPNNQADDERSFVQEVQRLLGRALSADEARLAATLRADKTAALVARELEGSAIADPKKIRPEHRDTATE